MVASSPETVNIAIDEEIAQCRARVVICLISSIMYACATMRLP